MEPCAALLTHPPAPLSGADVAGGVDIDGGDGVVEQEKHSGMKPQPAEEEQDEFSNKLEEATTGDEHFGEQPSDEGVCRQGQEASEAQEERGGEEATCVEDVAVVEEDVDEEGEQEGDEEDRDGEDVDEGAETEREEGAGGDTDNGHSDDKDGNDKDISDDKDSNENKDVTDDKDGSDDEDDGVPEIMRVRQKNIARNEAMMAKLSVRQVKPPPSPASKERLPAKRARTTRSPSTVEGLEARTGVRKSRRLSAKATAPDEELPPNNDLLALPGTWLNCLAGVGGKTARHDYGPELDSEQAAEKLKALTKDVDERDDKKAGTASIQHCFYRVQTMNNAQLGRRVRAIERARGAKAVEKMLVFVKVLKATNREELAAEAEASLDRLVRNVPMPEKTS